MSIVFSARVFRTAAKEKPVQHLGCKFFVGLVLASFGINTSSLATQCNGKPDALGTSRVIAVDPKDHPRIGTMQYPETLPLADHEVVITFDDGPSPRYTDRVLEILASECVKATFFMVGRMAATFQDEARKVEAGGHTIGTHSLSHPFTFGRMTESQAGQEIDGGIAAVAGIVIASLGPRFMPRPPSFLVRIRSGFTPRP